MSSATEAHVRTLSNGQEIPLLALGTWQIPDGPTAENAVRWALELGDRDIDTAQVYGNETSVGRALAESGVPREHLFVTTKFNPSRKDPAAELERSLQRLGLEYVDLYLIHWPQRGPTWAWRGMERALELGYAHSIGASNFNVNELDQLLALSSVPPVVNRVQFSPLAYRRALLEASQARGIVVEAYSPLGTGRNLSNSVVDRIATSVGRTPAQVLLRWCVQRDTVVLTKSAHRERIQENATIFDFTHSEDDMAALDGLDRTGGTAHALERPWW
jgi:diketogulonate reductase-like aldo/keto reductase